MTERDAIVAELRRRLAAEPADLARQLAGWAGMRNVLGHLYPTLDLARVHAAIAEDLGALERFAAVAAGWIDE